MKLTFKCSTIIICLLICSLACPVITFSKIATEENPEETLIAGTDSKKKKRKRAEKAERDQERFVENPKKTVFAPEKTNEISKSTVEIPEKITEVPKRATETSEKNVEIPKKTEILSKQLTSSDEAADLERFVSIDFNNVDINVLIKFISELTGKNFIIDSKVKGKVTIISPTKISVDEAYKVFESVLEVQGFATVTAGEVIKILPSSDARTKNIETKLREDSDAPEDKIVTQLIPLKYANPAEIKRLFAPMVSKYSVMLAYPQTNMLIVTDMYSNIKRLLGILKAIDITGIGQEVTVIPIQYADAVKFVKILEAVFKSTKPAKGATAANAVKFVADERTNSIITFASELDTERINKLVNLLDKEAPRGNEKIHVYYLENATADDLAKVLMAIPSKKASTSKAGKKVTAPVISTDVKITADKATNSLIIMAEVEEFKALESIIKKLDIPRSMVYVECLIMEVLVTKSFGLGAEWLAGAETVYEGKSAYYGGGVMNSGSLLNAATGKFPPGFSMGMFGESIEINGVRFPSIGAIIDAFKTDSDVNILSTPQIMTTDNEEASITVGQNIPYQTRTGTTTTESSYSNYEYKDVGISLKITPQISQDRLVRLKIEQTINKVSGTISSTPTTLKRTINTTVIVNDSNTVVIGGLIDDTLSNSERSVPCLGSIPLLGWMFKSVGQSSEKTNLYVFITPHVLKSSEDAKAIFSEKEDAIKGVKGRIKMYNQNNEDMPSTYLNESENPDQL